MDSVVIFLSLFVGIGVLQFIDGYKLWGPFSNYIRFDLSISIIESFWIIVCVVMLFMGVLTTLEMMLPISYIAYNIVIGFMTKESTLGSDSIEECVKSLSKPVLISITVFGAVFSIFSAVLLMLHEPLFPNVSFIDYLYIHMWKFIAALSTVVILLCCWAIFKRKAFDTFERQLVEAIKSNEDCIRIFGGIESVCFERELSQQLDANYYAFRVVGAEESGIVIGELEAINDEEESLVQGLAYLDNGEQIEIMRKGLEA